MTWLLITLVVLNGVFVVGGNTPYDSQEECAKALVAFEEAPATAEVTNWHGVCLPSHREPRADGVRT